MSDYQTAQDALRYIDPHDRDTWVRMAMAVKSALGDEGFDLWDSWSRSADNYKERDARSVWGGIKSDGGISLGTLIHEARQRGFIPDRQAQPLTSAQIAQRKREQAERAEKERQQKEQKQREVQAEAKALIAGRPFVTAHPYLTRKGVKASRIYQLQNGCIGIPMRDERGELWSVQTINDAGEKLFLKEGRAKGLYFSIGRPTDGKIVICEGYATGASIHEATGYAVAVAFSAGNLDDIAVKLRAKYPKAEIIVAGDLGNGAEDATKAAQAVNGKVAFPELTEGKDFNDLHTTKGLDAVMQQINAAKPVEEQPQSTNERANQDTGVSVSLIRASDITPQPINWIWEDWLARGKLHIVAGAPGCGKTTIAMAIAATVTLGGRWPDGSKCQAGNVLIWSGEDDSADTLIPRLHAVGANADRAFFISGAVAGGKDREFDPSTDIQPLLTKAETIGDISLVIIDPVVNVVSGDSHKNGEVRRALQPVVELAKRLNAAVFGISHFSKGGAGKDPVERVTGSVAFGALPRVVMAAAKCKDGDVERRIFVRSKSNIGPDGGGFEYSVEQLELPAFPNVRASRVLWGAPLDGTARELLAVADTDDAPEEKALIDEAGEWLAARLDEGAVESKTILQEGAKQGYNQRLLQRARGRIGAVFHKEGFGANMRSTWRLPPLATTNPSNDNATREGNAVVTGESVATVVDGEVM